MSHGELGYIYAKDTHYKLENVWGYFTAPRCPTLAGKPKLFFIQACQGDRLDGGITLSRTETDSSENQTMNYKIPIHADFLIAYSTIPGKLLFGKNLIPYYSFSFLNMIIFSILWHLGFYSWRNTTKGSWFMQCLCQELEQNGKKYDILTLLTFVCQRVAVDFESNTPDNPIMHQQKQIPCITTMLTRLLRFHEK